jgi:ankyrin repeat protein
MTPLQYACQYSASPEIVRLLIDTGADVNARTEVSLVSLSHCALPYELTCACATQGQEMPLQLAFKAGATLEVLWVLIEKGADVHVRNNVNGTTIHLACECFTSPEVVQLLIDKGVDMNGLTDVSLRAFD